MGVLVALCALFLALGYLRGPQLSSAQLDTAAVVTAADTTLRLFLNQPVAEVDSAAVTVQPSASVSVSSDADLVSVQFDEPLDYNTAYTVTVDSLVSESGGAVSSVSYTFTTGEPEIFYLDRDPNGDEIVRTGLSGSQREVMFTGEKIQEFAAAGDLLVVTTAAADRTGSVTLVNPQTKITERLLLPEVGEVTDLDASRSGAVVGFTISSADPGPVATISHTLYTVDLDRGRGVVAVTDFDGEPMRVAGWQFIPGTTTVVALTTESTLVRVDLSTGEILPLGQFFEFDRVSADGSHVVVRDARGIVAVSLDGQPQRRLTPSLIDGQRPFLGQSDAARSGDVLAKMVLVGEAGSRFSSVLGYDDGEISRIVFQAVGQGGAVLDFRLSPNGQLVTVEVQPDAAVFDSDQYVMVARPQSVTTFVVDVVSGAVSRSVEGFAAVWR
ncbi:MAG: Ig-like domain-containing protein [Rhodoglobus sp.]